MGFRNTQEKLEKFIYRDWDFVKTGCELELFFNYYFFLFRYAFLRCEDEREQCMHYLQTLNTVDFSCFTNAYSKSSMLYQVLIFPSQKSAGASVTSANVWLHVVGSLSETPSILRLPRGVIHFSFWAKNLGIITSLRMGHDNAGNNPNW